MRKIEFVKNGSRYEAEFVPTGNDVMQINRSAHGGFNVFAKLGGSETPYVSIYCEPRIGNRKNIIFCLDLPQGVMAKIVSYTEVLSAYADTIA